MTSTATAAQTKRLREALLKRPHHTLELRQYHHVTSPPQRVYDLRKLGFQITSERSDIVFNNVFYKQVSTYKLEI